MRILYIGAFRFPCYDAAAARVLNNARALQKAGNKVSIISWGGLYRKDDLCEDGKYCIDGINYTITNELETEGGIIRKTYCFLKRGNRTLEVLHSMSSRPDVIIPIIIGQERC